MKARFTGYVCAAAIAAVIGSGAAFAQEKTFELKLSHWVPPSHPLQKALEEWGADVEKESGGTIHYKVFPAQQLGKALAPRHVFVVSALPKTRSGKIARGAIARAYLGQPPGDLSSLENPAALGALAALAQPVNA